MMSNSQRLRQASRGQESRGAENSTCAVIVYPIFIVKFKTPKTNSLEEMHKIFLLHEKSAIVILTPKFNFAP